MANGRLAAPHAPGAAEGRRRGDRLGADAVALALILRQPWAGVVLSGAATVAQLGSNLHAAAVDLDEDQLARLPPWWRSRARTGSGAAQLPWH